MVLGFRFALMGRTPGSANAPRMDLQAALLATKERAAGITAAASAGSVASRSTSAGARSSRRLLVPNEPQLGGHVGLYWNTIYIEHEPVGDKLARLTPTLFEHVNPLGTTTSTPIAPPGRSGRSDQHTPRELRRTQFAGFAPLEQRRHAWRIAANTGTPQLMDSSTARGRHSACRYGVAGR